jgi:hypothetical protein
MFLKLKNMRFRSQMEILTLNEYLIYVDTMELLVIFRFNNGTMVMNFSFVD